MIFIPESDFDGTLVKYESPSKLNTKCSINEVSLRAAYEFLCSCKPFSGWKMPHNVRFKVSTSTMTCGMYEPDPHTITISKASNKDYTEVLKTLAHEALHLHLERTRGGHEDHDELFCTQAAYICTHFGWNPKEF